MTGLPPNVEIVRPVSSAATCGLARASPMGPPFAKPLAESGCQAPLHTDAEPVAAPPAPAGLDFIANEDAAMGADDPLDDLEIFLGRRDETATPWIGSATNPATLAPVELPTISLRTRDR